MSEISTAKMIEFLRQWASCGEIARPYTEIAKRLEQLERARLGQPGACIAEEMRKEVERGRMARELGELPKKRLVELVMELRELNSMENKQ